MFVNGLRTVICLCSHQNFQARTDPRLHDRGQHSPRTFGWIEAMRRWCNAGRLVRSNRPSSPPLKLANGLLAASHHPGWIQYTTANAIHRILQKTAFSTRSQLAANLSFAPPQKNYPTNSSPAETFKVRPSIALNKRLLDYAYQGDWKGILTLFEKEGHDFDEINFATAISRLAKIQHFELEDPIFPVFLQAMEVKIREPAAAPQCYATVAHALAKLKYRQHNEASVRIFRRLDDPAMAVAFVEKANFQDIGNTTWACAKLGYASPAFFAAVDYIKSQQLVADGTTQIIANTAWGCAEMGHPSPTLFAAIESHAEWFVANALSQEIAMTARACAKLRHPSPELFAAIKGKAAWLAANGSTQTIANIAWAFAELGYSSPELYAALEGFGKNGSAREIAMTARAYAKLGHSPQELFDDIENRADWLVHCDDTQAIANVAWACGELNQPCPIFFAAIERRSHWLVFHSNPQEIAMIARSCAKLGHVNEALFRVITRRANWLVMYGDPQNVAVTALACAKLRHLSRKLFVAIENRSEWLVKNGTPQNIANTAWACAILDHPCPNLFAAIERRADWLVSYDDPQHVSSTVWAFEKLGHSYPNLMAAMDRLGIKSTS
jgi:hypothetical protein